MEETTTPKVFVVTSNNYLWTLRPFSYLFTNFWPGNRDVYILGYAPPPTDYIPANFHFISMGYDLGPRRWTTPFRRFLENISDTNFILLLDDYWLCRPVDNIGVTALFEFAQMNQNILRLDLTSDRFMSGHAQDHGYCGYFDLITTPPETPYQMSLQAAIWNRELMLKLMDGDLSPWEVEMHTTVPDSMVVMGTKQNPVRYANAVYKGSVDTGQLSMIEPEMRETVIAMLPENWKAEIPVFA